MIENKKAQNNTVSDTKIKSKKDTKNDIAKLENKLSWSRAINVALSIFLLFFILAATIIFVVCNSIYQSFKPHFSALFGKGYNLASISDVFDEKKIDIEKFSTKLSYIDDVVNLFYYYDKDNKAIEDGMFAGYMNALGDKYAEYYSAKEFEDFTETTTEGVYYGIGCTVTQDLGTNDCIVNLVYEDSPAEKGGLQKDDIFVSVNGENVRGIELNELVQKIKGEEGAERVIEVYRPSQDSIVKLTVYCGKVDIKLIRSEIYEGDIGYIAIDQFTGKASSQFKIEIDKLMAQDIKSLIIDLRDNPGGELITVCEMIDYIMRDNDGRYTLNQKETNFDEGKTLLVYIKEKDEIVDATYADDKHSVELPIVILTNLNTASAAELFTECLRDYKKAQVVGLRTYGKGVVQNILPYEDGSAIKFTVSEYFPPSGYSIDKRGITPDYSVNYYGEEVLYDEDNNIIVNDDDTMYVYNNDGKVIGEIVATKSNVDNASKSNADIANANNTDDVDDAESKTDNEAHEENLKIYDYDNNFLDEDWFIDLDTKYDDKQILQAIVILKN